MSVGAEQGLSVQAIANTSSSTRLPEAKRTIGFIPRVTHTDEAKIVTEQKGNLTQTTAPEVKTEIPIILSRAAALASRIPLMRGPKK